MHPRKGLFFSSLLLTLLLMLPLVGAVAFLATQREAQLRLKQAAALRGGVAVEAGSQTTLRLLLAIQQETPAFLLLRVDAPAQTVTFCALPSSLQLQAPAGTTTLAECYTAAGPARAAQLLEATVGMAPDSYFAATPDCWADIYTDAVPPGEDASIRFDTAALLDSDTREALGYEDDSVAVLDAEAAAALLSKQAEETPALRAAVWAAFWRQNVAVAAALPQCAKGYSSRTLTDLTAQQYTELAQALGWLAARDAPTIDYTEPETEPTKSARDTLRLTDAGTAEVQKMLG